MATASRRTVRVRTARKPDKQTAGSALHAVRVDARGRVTLPAGARHELGIHPGEVFWIEKASYGFRLAKAENPFDGLLRHAEAEYRAGTTRSLREFARAEGIALDEE